MIYEDDFVIFIYNMTIHAGPTRNCYERVKYGCRNIHVTKAPLSMLKVLDFILYYCLC